MLAVLALSGCAGSAPDPETTIAESSPSAIETPVETAAPAPVIYPYKGIVTTGEGFQFTVSYDWVPAGQAVLEPSCLDGLRAEGDIATDVTFENTGFTAVSLVGTVQMTSPAEFAWPAGMKPFFGFELNDSSGEFLPSVNWNFCGSSTALPVPTAEAQEFATTVFMYEAKTPSNPEGATAYDWSKLTAKLSANIIQEECLFEGQEAVADKPCQVPYVS
jgi:hypothetical protein